MFILLTGKAYVAKSQNSSDTLCFPIPVIQKLLIAAKQKPLADSLNAVLRSDIAILQQQVGTLRLKDSLQAQIADTYRAMVATQQQQREALEREVRRWKRKNTWTAIGGVMLTAITTAFIHF